MNPVEGYQEIFQKMRNYYLACTNESTSSYSTWRTFSKIHFHRFEQGERDKLGVKGLLWFLNDNGGWPLIDSRWAERHPFYVWETYFASLNQHFQAGYILKITMIPLNQRLVLRVIIIYWLIVFPSSRVFTVWFTFPLIGEWQQVEPSSFGIGLNTLRNAGRNPNERPNLQAYREFIYNSFLILKEQLAALQAEQGLELEIEPDEQIRAQIEDIIKFEQQLASLTSKQSSPTEETSTIETFQSQTGVGWEWKRTKLDLNEWNWTYFRFIR